MPSQKEYTVFAIDYGEARMGIAMGNSILQIPHPLVTIQAEGVRAKIEQLSDLILKWQPQLIVVGCPHEHDNLRKIQLINTINNFVKKIKHKFNIPVVVVNEDFTSSHASGLLNEQGIFGKAQKGKLDQLAACSILQTYFSQYR